MVGYKNSKHKEIDMAKKNTETEQTPYAVKEPVKKAIPFMDGLVKIKMTGEDKGDVLIVNLEEYFERLHRQGWACVKRERT